MTDVEKYDDSDPRSRPISEETLLQLQLGGAALQIANEAAADGNEIAEDNALAMFWAVNGVERPKF